MFAVVQGKTTRFLLPRNSRTRMDISRHGDLHPEQAADQCGPSDTRLGAVLRLLRFS